MLGLLRETVDENASVDLNDMVPLKRSLESLGHYRPTEGVGLHVFPDELLFKGIRSFQKQEGLKVDGVMKPGGPTENRLLKRMTEQMTPSAPGSERLTIVTDNEFEKQMRERAGLPPKEPETQLEKRQRWRHGEKQPFSTFKRVDRALRPHYPRKTILNSTPPGGVR